ncbi:hypothetical protein [Thiomicrorhabdus xiamenensis]|uniref:Uncharacterized protein n=1 Tax=Thiomicrorhabdus xiamenensis TaxID=2739063 RepID=A0A7D4SHZ3_9GAMM|nr:hypothetical protein [Thiomicrorhabdus xiamenensis]QKI88960.1 hypothetical protein HQN79_04930 [Thiomicrorhabdus xiamenensis]
MFDLIKSENILYDQLIISYQVHNIVDSFQHQLWIVKDDGITEIELISELQEPSHVMTIDKVATFDYEGFAKDFISREDLRGCYADISGVVSAERWNELVKAHTDAFNKQSEAYVQRQEANPSEIYTVVKELGLQPFNPGYNEYSWYANCPSGKQHNMMFSTKSNGWGCGYCKVKGGPEELTGFYHYMNEAIR